MKFDVKPHLRIDANNNVSGGATVYCVKDDVQLSMRVTDESFTDGFNTKGVVLAAKQPGAFEFRYDVGKHAPSFKVHTGMTINDRKWNMRLSHGVKPKSTTMLEASTAVNDENTMTLMYDLTGYERPDLKHASVKWCWHTDDLHVEPGYCFNTESMFAEVRYRLDDDNHLKARFNTHDNHAMLEWRNCAGMGGGGDMMVSATMNLDADGMKRMPCLRAEKMWSMDF